MKRLRLCSLLLAFAAALASHSAIAQEQRTLSRADLMALARQFVTRVGDGLAQAEEQMAPSPPSPADRRQQALESLLEGEELLLQVRIARLDIDRTILGVKQGKDIMLSLADFVGASDFAIAVDADAQRAEGFYIREDQKFLLDIPSGRVQARDRVFTLGPGDVEIIEGDIRVKSTVLAQWFDFSMDVDVSMQRLDIVSAQKWPVQERIERERKKNAISFNEDRTPKLPELEQGYQAFTVPNVDVTLRQTYTKDPEEEKAEKRTQYSVQATGDVVHHTARVNVSGNERERLSTVYVNMRRESEDPELLGSLHAKSYEFGDITTVQVPHAGPSPSELGARISNRNPFVTSGTTTQITGASVIGWDVELFRNDQYIAIATVDETGQYVFNDVPLVGGVNRFRIVSYGPLGEIREEEQIVTVDPNLYTAGGIGIYDASLSLQNTRTWTANPSKDADKNTPHVSATLARQIGGNTSGHAGIRVRQESEEMKAYANTGVATSVNNVILNGDVTIDHTGPFLVTGTARKTFDRQNAGISATYQSENFNPGSPVDRPAQLSLLSYVNGPMPWINSRNYNYEWNSGAVFRDDGFSSYNQELSLNARVNRLFFNHSMDHVTTNYPNGESEEVLEGDLSVRGAAWKAIWRAGLGYGIKPDSGIQDYRVGVSKALSRTVKGDISIRHETEDNYTIGDVSLDWSGKKVRVSPSVSYDTDDVINAQLAMRFGLTQDPFSGDILMRGETVGGIGGVSALVFLDKNGDRVLSDEDELLEGVVVRAAQVNRETETGPDGQAFLYNLPSGRLTDVFIEEGGSLDATWISAFPGVSIRPRPGVVARLEFPIHMSGEIDGTLYVQPERTSPRPLKNVRIGLFDQGGRRVVSAKSASDGFYLFEKIPPGDYYLIADPDDLRTARVSGVAPIPIHIGYEGTVIYGKNITYPVGRGVGFGIVSTDTLQQSHPGVATPPGSQVILNLGSYHSPLTMALVWYRFKMRYAKIAAGLVPLSSVKGDDLDADVGLHTLRLRMTSGDMNEAVRRCRALAARDIFCTVEFMPGPKAVSDAVQPPRRS